MGLIASTQLARSRRSFSRPGVVRCIFFVALCVVHVAPPFALGQLALTSDESSDFASTRSGQLAQVRAHRFLAGRTIAGGASAAQAMDAARKQHAAMLAQQAALLQSSLTASWQPVGPNQVASLAYGSVTGRVTAIAIDPADPTGNTVYVGTAGGGVWKSNNAAGPAASVTFIPLTDALPVFSANAGDRKSVV